MPTKLQKEYLKNLCDRYQKSTKKMKSYMLSDFCVNSGYSRKHASRILNGRVEPRIKKPGPKVHYDGPFLLFLKDLWEATGRLCGKNLEAAIPLWLPKSPVSIPEEIKKKLNTVSASTIDRALRGYKKTKPKGLSTTRSSSFKNQIPIRTLDAEAKCPGIVNADTVAHCGDNIGGDYMNSLTVTDLYSGWTLNRAIWKKDALGTIKQIKKIEATLPFFIVEFFSDNGTEFINHELQDYFEKRPAPVNVRRTRAYKKNDACYVEQKNYTHVRKLFGYVRVPTPELVALANEIYQIYWNPLQNFFIPSRKLIKKARVGSKIVKEYDEPKTPYQRLIDSGYLTNEQQRALIKTYNNLNPYFLRNELDKKLKMFFQTIEEYNKTNYNKVG